MGSARQRGAVEGREDGTDRVEARRGTRKTRVPNTGDYEHVDHVCCARLAVCAMSRSSRRSGALSDEVPMKGSAAIIRRSASRKCRPWAAVKANPACTTCWLELPPLHRHASPTPTTARRRPCVSAGARLFVATARRRRLLRRRGGAHRDTSEAPDDVAGATLLALGGAAPDDRRRRSPRSSRRRRGSQIGAQRIHRRGSSSRRSARRRRRCPRRGRRNAWGNDGSHLLLQRKRPSCNRASPWRRFRTFETCPRILFGRLLSRCAMRSHGLDGACRRRSCSLTPGTRASCATPIADVSAVEPGSVRPRGRSGALTGPCERMGMWEVAPEWPTEDDGAFCAEKGPAAADVEMSATAARLRVCRPSGATRTRKWTWKWTTTYRRCCRRDGSQTLRRRPVDRPRRQLCLLLILLRSSPSRFDRGIKRESGAGGRDGWRRSGSRPPKWAPRVGRATMPRLRAGVTKSRRVDVAAVALATGVRRRAGVRDACSVGALRPLSRE